MANIVYKSLSSLSPVALKYKYYRDENLISTANSYYEGYNFYQLQGLTNFQDVAINKGSCFVLTSSIDIDTVFSPPSQTLNVNFIPSSFILNTINFDIKSINYVSYLANNNSFSLNLSGNEAVFTIVPIISTNKVELFVNNKNVIVDKNYPYVISLTPRSLDKDNLYRQRFEIDYQNNVITIKTVTTEGYRYLAIGSDNVLRATGMILNDAAIGHNNYAFNCIPVTSPSLNIGFIPTNNWVSYFYDIESGVENKTVTVNRNINSVPTNFLIDFSVEAALESGNAIVNIANLKTTMTPTGGPSPFNNIYTPIEPITN